MSENTSTIEQILLDIHFQERLDEIKTKIPSTLALVKHLSIAKRNQVRRKLYRDSEFIRIEIEEKLNEIGLESEYTTSPIILNATTELDAIRHQLRLDGLPPAKGILNQAYLLLRFATFCLLFVGWFSAITALIPLRWIQPLLRRMGFSNNQLPLNIISCYIGRLLCLTGGQIVTVEGQENLMNLKEPVVCMFSHSSNLDGFVVNGYSPMTFKFAAKKSLFMIPFLGWGSRWAFGYVAIDRSNRKRALKSLKELAQAVDVDGESVCLSPEGTRSKDGLLSEFKKGPFYLREDTKKNIVPALVFGAYEMWSSGSFFSSPGHSLVRFLPEFKPDPTKNRNLNRLAVRRIFLDAFTEDIPENIGTPAEPNSILFNLAGIYAIWIVTYKVLTFTLYCVSLFCYYSGLSYWTFTHICLVITIILEVIMYRTC